MALMDDSTLSNVNGIITLQVGHYSNFIGTHWWNIQHSSHRKQSGKLGQDEDKEINHGLLLREDIESGTGKIKYTPRLVCIDLKGSLKALKEDGSFEKNEKISERQKNSTNDEVMVDNDIAPSNLSIHQTDAIKRVDIFKESVALHANNYHGRENVTQHNNIQFNHNYFSLDNVVEVWSDFLGNEYHNKSVLLLDDYWYNPDSCSFSSFGQGFSADTNHKFWDSWKDSMRFFAEECDSLQGFQILSDLDDGFSGLTIKLLNNLKDYYGPKSVAVYGSWPGESNQFIDENIQIMNSALAVGHISQSNQLFVPLSLQESFYAKENSNREFMHLSYQPRSHYQTSGIIASYLDTISLQYRAGNAMFSEFCHGITMTGHSIASARIALPFPLHSPSLETMTKTDIYANGVMTGMTPSMKNQFDKLFSCQMVLRGIPAEFEEFDARTKRLQKRISNKDLFEMFVFNTHKSYRTGTTFCADPLPTNHPYPRYFSSSVDRSGFLQVPEKKHGSVENVPVLSNLSASDGMFDFLHDVIESANRAKTETCILNEQYGIEKDEINENIEQLINIAHLYDETRATELF